MRVVFVNLLCCKIQQYMLNKTTKNVILYMARV